MAERSREILMEGENEQIAGELCDLYVKTRGTRMPSYQQKDWATLIEHNRGNDAGLAKDKQERREIVDKLDGLFDKMVATHKAVGITEIRRGEIVTLAIKKLVERRAILEKQFIRQ